MADTVVVGDGGEEGSPAAAESAHQAAVAEGAVAVQAQQATEAAEEAKAAAEVALEAAKTNIESGAAVEAATQAAEVSAAQATVSAEMVHEALIAQTAAINALAEEMKAARESAPKEKPEPKGADRAPAQKEHFINRKIGGRR